MKRIQKPKRENPYQKFHESNKQAYNKKNSEKKKSIRKKNC